MATSLQVEFILTGNDLQVEDLLSTIDLDSVKTWKIGDPIGTSLLKYKHNGWCFETNKIISIDLPEEVEKVVKILKPYKTRLLEIIRKYGCEAELSCVLYIEDNDIPIVHFPRDIVEFISELNGEIDIDIYLNP